MAQEIFKEARSSSQLKRNSLLVSIPAVLNPATSMSTDLKWAKRKERKKKAHLKINHPEDGASTLLARLHPADVRSSIYFHRVASCALSPSAGSGDVREFPTTDACAMDVLRVFIFSLNSYCGWP